eukprot:5814962-Heterocapsa_arctica.AAC.1
MFAARGPRRRQRFASTARVYASNCSTVWLKAARSCAYSEWIGGLYDCMSVLELGLTPEQAVGCSSSGARRERKDPAT